MRGERYPKYKPTGIAWLPEVPEGWAKVRFWNTVRFKKDRNHVTEPMLSVYLDKGVVYTADTDGKQVHKPPEDLSDYQLVLPGDFVMNNQQCWRGSVGVSCLRGIISPAYFVFELSREYYWPKFADYYLRDRYMVTQYRIASKGVGSIQQILCFPWLKATYSFLPNLGEQKQMASYLDEKCGKVDRLVAAKEKEAALLKELKQSMVAEFVTCGIDHKAMNVPTGVFWQPLMPEGWRVKKCRYALQKLNRSRPKDAELLVCTNKGKVNKRGDAKIGLVSEDETIYQGVAAGDLLIHGMDTWHGAIAVSELEGMCTPVVHVCDSKENKKFVAFCFQNMARGRLFKLISNGVRQNTSDFRSWEKVAQLPLVLPPRKEQDRIVLYVESKASKIDAAVKGLEREVAALKEYKQRLIADVVTGQRKVA